MKKLFVLVCLLAIGFCNVAWAAKRQAKHVVLIALDGWGAYSVPKADIPNIKSLMDEGCYTLHKRSVFPSSSAINWASMFMGVGTELHGYTEWGSRTPEIPSRVVNEHGISPTIFSVMRQQYPEAETGCLYEWEGIKYLVDTLALSYHAQAPDYDKYPTALCEMAEKYIKDKKPAMLAVCFDQLDHTGHAVGHDTPGYYEKLKELTGKTPGEYIRMVRLDHASKLLRTTQLTVQEIMYKSGFSSKSYFYKEFAARFGLSPKEYRKANCK